MQSGPEADSKRLLVLGAGPAQLGLLEAARGRGLHVIAVDRDPLAPGFRYAHRRAVVSVEDEAAVTRLAAAERVDGIIAPGIDFPVAIAARVAERHKLPHPITPDVAQHATSKLRQRERLAEAGVRHARYRVCSSLFEAREAVDALGLPSVVKPPDRQGQRGVSVVKEPGQLEAAFDAAVAAARSSAVLVEELVQGPELTVNGFSAGGKFTPLTVTDRVVAEPPAFGVALAHVWPSEQPDDAVAGCVELARRAADAVGVATGPTYTQVLLGSDGPVVGELAARLGGGHDAELCRAALGVDLNGLALAAALGEDIARDKLSQEIRAGGACIRFLVPPEGTLDEVAGADEAAADDGVVWVRVYHAPGHVFGPFRRGSDRAGAVLAVGESREEALSRATRAAGRVRFHTVAHASVQP